MRVCVITDNLFLYYCFKSIAMDKCKKAIFDYFYSHFNNEFLERFKRSSEIVGIDLNVISDDFINMYDLFISLHCKQIFPNKLVDNHRCINIHPGYNPYNRGWAPHVFSIINNLPTGVTIHEMDAHLDHGPIIFQEQISIDSWDTSESVYSKIQKLEIEMIEKYLPILLSGEYKKTFPSSEGNMNTKNDFNKLCELKLDDIGTLREHIDLLRALSHSGYNNAFFYSGDEKVYVSLELKKT